MPDGHVVGHPQRVRPQQALPAEPRERLEHRQRDLLRQIVALRSGREVAAYHALQRAEEVGVEGVVHHAVMVHDGAEIFRGRRWN